MLSQTIPTPAPKEALSLPEPIVQSQENVQPQHHIPIPFTPTSTYRPHMYHSTNRPKNAT